MPDSVLTNVYRCRVSLGGEREEWGWGIKVFSNFSLKFSKLYLKPATFNHDFVKLSSVVLKQSILFYVITLFHNSNKRYYYCFQGALNLSKKKNPHLMFEVLR